MNIFYILGITVLFSTYSSESTEKVLLRRLQSEQPESKPMWNEVLADVLVNKIKIFSFKNDKQNESIKEATIEKSVITNIFSQVFYVYKKFVYDVFVTQTISDHSIETTTHNISTEIEDRTDVFKGPGVVFSEGPKSEVELVEPRYHGKQVETSETDGKSDVTCPEGTVNKDGSCVVSSRLLLAIPSQCPIGYKRDRLGYCRMIF